MRVKGELHLLHDFLFSKGGGEAIARGGGGDSTHRRVDVNTDQPHTERGEGQQRRREETTGKETKNTEGETRGQRQGSGWEDGEEEVKGGGPSGWCGVSQEEKERLRDKETGGRCGVNRSVMR